MSFFHPTGSRDDEARYSFYRPAPGLLAFGCSRLARDRTRSIGAFTHNFVCEESEFLSIHASPLSLLQCLPFVRSEHELPPESRSLPTVEIDPTNQQSSAPHCRDLALQLLDFHLGSGTAHVPLVVAPEDETWLILTEIFTLLPRVERTRLSFSTLFVDAAEFVAAFSLVFVPDRAHIPAGSYVFRIFDAHERPPAEPKPTAFADFWRSHADRGLRLVGFVDALRHGPPSEAAEILPELLELGRPFRASLEFLKVTETYDLLLTKAHWIVAYWKAGEPLSYSRVQDALWESPLDRLIPLLDATEQLRERELRDQVLCALATRVARGQLGIDLIGFLASAGMLVALFDVASSALATDDLQRLAVRMRDAPFYALQLHEAIARRVLDQIVHHPRDRSRKLEEWLRDEARLAPGAPFLGAAAGLIEWADAAGRVRLQLNAYPLNPSQYTHLLNAAWSIGEAAGLSGPGLVQALFHVRNRNVFLEFFAARLADSHLSVQKRMIDAFFEVCQPDGRDHEILIGVIHSLRNSVDIARYYRKGLERMGPHQTVLIERLRAVEQRSGWKSLFRG